VSIQPEGASPIAAIIDVDGVLYDYVGDLAVIAATHLNRPLSDFPPAQVWEFFSKQWGLSLQEYLELVDVGVTDYGFIRTGTPLIDSIEGIHCLISAGVEVHIATDLGEPGDPKGHQRARLDWLSAQGLDLTTLPVTFTSNKHDVAEDYLSRGYRVFALDDKVTNYHLLNEVGATCYLFTQNYNRTEPAVNRTSSVLAFAEALGLGSTLTVDLINL
jgi:hypothetical protein